MSVLRKIPGPFGGLDEQAMTDQFEELMGGRDRAGRLCSILRDSYPQTGYGYWVKAMSKTEVFRSKASREGFSTREIDAILELP